MDKIRVCPECYIASKDDGSACPHPMCGHVFTDRMAIERFGCEPAEIEPDPKGDWVKYEDYIELLRAMKVASQAIREFAAAQERGPRWYTRGEDGMYRQVNMWLRKGLEVCKPYEEACAQLDPRAANDEPTQSHQRKMQRVHLRPHAWKRDMAATGRGVYMQIMSAISSSSDEFVFKRRDSNRR